MLKVRIIPCLDVKNSVVVKGVQFKNLEQITCPLEAAYKYTRNGADELCYLDITATTENRGALLNNIEKISKRCFIPLTVGGGIKNTDNIRAALLAGADKVSLNTSIVYSPEILTKAANIFGSQSIVAAIDAKKIKNDWLVHTHGGSKPTEIKVTDFVQEAEEKGAGEILLTSMDRDGSKNGYDKDLLREVTSLVGVPVIASGGAGSPEDMIEAIQEGGASAVLAASIFHYNKYSIKEIKNKLRDNDIPVRII